MTGDGLLLVGTGLLGSFTTFSTWMLETERLGEEGEGRLAVANIVRLARGRARRCGARLAAGSGAVNDDCLKLTVYFGESDRAGDRLLSDALLDLFERHELHAACSCAAVEGFGIKHALRTRSLPVALGGPAARRGRGRRAARGSRTSCRT